jgi:cephalosporin hydroxylase
VLTIDIVAYPHLPRHERITYLLGSSTSGEILQKLKDSIHSGERVMVSLDSDHTKAHVLDELRLYSNVVTVNNYLVVEDTTTLPGPKEAVDEFLKTNSNYVQDRSREKFGATMFEGGWLKRVR